jgi:hypothetical protein
MRVVIANGSIASAEAREQASQSRPYKGRLLCLLAFVWLSLGATKVVAAEVLTQRGNNERTGTYTDNVIDQQLVSDPNRWGSLPSLQILGTVYAQPLYAENVVIPGLGQHNVVLLASALNVLSAYDARTLSLIWTVNTLGSNDKTKLGHLGCDGISDNFSNEGIGIEATPVIDRNRNHMIVSYRKNDIGAVSAARQRLALIDIASGKVLRTVEIAPPEQDADWHIWHRSRASLLLVNDVVYVAFGSRCEDPGTPTFRGWIIAFAAETLDQVGAFSPTIGNSAFPNGVDGGGIWQGSSGLAADSSGDFYLLTGNRRLSGCKPAPCDAFSREQPNLADSFIRVTPRIQRDASGKIVRVDMQVHDWFSPYRKIWLDDDDLDLGSAGPVLLPDTNFLVGGGKQGILYLLDRTNMGKLDANPPFDGTQLDKIRQFDTYDQWPEDFTRDHVVQKFQAAINQYISGMHSKPDAHIAIEKQNARQLDAFIVGSNGAIWVTWEANDGQWADWYPQAPAEITPTGFALPGAHLAAAKQNDNQLDVFVVGNDGAIYVTWEVGDGRWTDGGGGQPGPARITPAGLAPPGGCVTAIKQNNNQLDAFVVGNDGAIYVTWEVNDGRWADGGPGQPGPARITPAGLAPPGSCVAAAKQNDRQLDAFVVGNDGAIYVTWEIDDGRWTDGAPGQTGPARITPANLAPRGSSVAAIKQNSSQLEAFVVGNDGAVYVTWEVNDGRWADGGPGQPGPARVTPAGLAPAGSCVAAAKQNDNQLDAFVVGRDGAVYVTWEINDGRWTDGDAGQTGPARITPAQLASAPACVAAIKQNDNQLDAFTVSKAGAIWVTWEVADGRWSDGGPGAVSPARLTPALRMHEWFHWPHIHGSPVFARFGDAGSFLYLWPEKDHLKAFPWSGNRFDVDRRILARDFGGAFVRTPPGPPFGMPGGMLSVSINPSKPRAGVLFASVARVPDQRLGLLRAFDPMSLHELWNNAGEDYPFAKFVSPLIADGKVFLPTAGPSNKVLVYGRRD